MVKTTADQNKQNHQDEEQYQQHTVEATSKFRKLMNINFNFPA